MPYVMIPVPEKYVRQAMQYVLARTADDTIEPWDHASVSDLFAAIDEPSRALLSIVATHVLSRTRGHGTGGSNGTSAPPPRHGRAHAGHQRVVRRSGTWADHPAPDRNPELPNGRTEDLRLLTMSQSTAELVQQVDREQLMADADPFADEVSNDDGD